MPGKMLNRPSKQQASGLLVRNEHKGPSVTSTGAASEPQPWSFDEVPDAGRLVRPVPSSLLFVMERGAHSHYGIFIQCWVSVSNASSFRGAVVLNQSFDP